MSELRIIVWDRGFVSVGYFSLENGVVTVTQGSVVRRWGTLRGLGQLALKGPQKNTILEFEGFTQGPFLNVIKTIRCNPEAWEGKLPDSVKES